MPHALALSPHLDDAAFSCGGTLARLAAAGWRVTLCTAFTRSVPDPTGFALACQLDKGLGPEVDYMALRRAEDDAACAALGATPGTLTPDEKELLDRDGYLPLKGILYPELIYQLRAQLDALIDEEGDQAGHEVHTEPGTQRLSDLVNK